MLNITLDCILLQRDDHLCKKLVPFIDSPTSVNYKFLFAIMFHKGCPQFFSVRIDIFAKKEHDGHPNIVRCNFDISMMNVCFVKGFEKSILMLFSYFATLIVKVNLVNFVLKPNGFSLHFYTFGNSLSFI